ncbi:MAG: PH domain-containing protein [Leucobacter sp.]
MTQPTDLDALLGPPPAAYGRPEAVVLRVRRHGRRLILPVLVLFVIAGVAGYWVGALPELWMNLAAGAGTLVLALLFGIGPILAWLTRSVTITSHRVIFRRGVFVRHRSEVSLAKVREVRTRRNPAQRLWGSGSIDLLVGVETIRIPDVPGVQLIADALQELVERNYEHATRSLGMAHNVTVGFPGSAPGPVPGL